MKTNKGEALKTGEIETAKLYAYLVKDENGHEAICGVRSDKLFAPLLYSDLKTLRKTEYIAKQIAEGSGSSLKLVSFSRNKIIEEWNE